MYISLTGGRCKRNSIRMKITFGFPDLDEIVDDDYWGENLKVRFSPIPGLQKGTLVDLPFLRPDFKGMTNHENPC